MFLFSFLSRAWGLRSKPPSLLLFSKLSVFYQNCSDLLDWSEHECTAEDHKSTTFRNITHSKSNWFCSKSNCGLVSVLQSLRCNQCDFYFLLLFYYDRRYVFSLSQFLIGSWYSARAMYSIGNGCIGNKIDKLDVCIATWCVCDKLQHCIHIYSVCLVLCDLFSNELQLYCWYHISIHIISFFLFPIDVERMWQRGQITLIECIICMVCLSEEHSVLAPLHLKRAIQIGVKSATKQSFSFQIYFYFVIELAKCKFLMWVWRCPYFCPRWALANHFQKI